MKFNSARTLSMKRFIANDWIRNTWEEPRDGSEDYPDGALLSTEEWFNGLESGELTPDDGSGYWGMVFTEGDTFLESDISSFDPMPDGANCVAWYSK